MIAIYPIYIMSYELPLSFFSKKYPIAYQILLEYAKPPNIGNEISKILLNILGNVMKREWEP